MLKWQRLWSEVPPVLLGIPWQQVWEGPLRNHFWKRGVPSCTLGGREFWIHALEASNALSHRVWEIPAVLSGLLFLVEKRATFRGWVLGTVLDIFLFSGARKKVRPQSHSTANRFVQVQLGVVLSMVEGIVQIRFHCLLSWMINMRKHRLSSTRAPS